MTPSRPVPSGEETRAQPEAAAQANDHREGVRTGEDSGRQPSPLLMNRNGAASVTAKVNTAEQDERIRRKKPVDRLSLAVASGGQWKRRCRQATASARNSGAGAEGIPVRKKGRPVTRTALHKGACWQT
ncbi:hypothetical protein [Buttiauxella agrestis]|uniref:hypothetical protein n=1 Tax=Buttiauxella agrestis TaxID=82977 RepID=UPI0039770132